MNNNDFLLMKEFFEENLEKSDLKKVPADYFECIVFCHVIEHLHNGEETLLRLLTKLKKGGIIYLEFPNSRSLSLPSMKPPFFGSTLNFYDDPTHVKVYELENLKKLLADNQFDILDSGRRKSWKHIIFFPFIL